MGKNKKLKNGVDQVQNYDILETDDHKEIPEDFLTSDDFCIVQKKKGYKKCSDCQDSKALFHSLSDIEKNNEDTDKSFWTCRVNQSVNDNSKITSENFNLKYLTNKHKVITNDSEFNLRDILEIKTDAVKSDLDPLYEENLFGNINPKKCDPATVENEFLAIKSSFVVNETTCTKIKHKKVVHKKKSVDEEVEKLLRELELDEKPVAEPEKTGTVIFCSTHSQSVNSQKLNSKTVAKHCHIDTCNEEIKKEGSILTNNFLPDFDNFNLHNVSNGTNSESKLLTKNYEKKSLKKKVKRLKCKQQNISVCENLKNSDSCKVGSNNVSNNKEIDGVGYVSSLSKNKLVLPKTADDSDRRGKRPSKKQLAIIHEALKKAKEEEEKLRKEAEMRQRMAEEAERIRQEKLRLEQEKKEKKKLKEKQRREKMKAEGRLLSKSQKQSRARMEATLAVLRQQGVEVPQISDKKPSSSRGLRLGNCKNFYRKRNNSSQSIQSNDSAIVVVERQKSESFSSQESSGKDSLSDMPSSFDSTDDSAMIPESDKGNFSCSEESDTLDDGICSELCKFEKITDVKNAQKSKLRKAEIPSLNQVKSSKCHDKVNYVKYRSPVVCVLGHVDTGKTKLLDYVRKTHVQDSEAGGITQQIGATMIPRDALKEKCKMVKNFSSFSIEIPGLLVIDTPGHKSFSNLRSRGSSVCDIAILVVDIMHGLEPQTLESINLLKKGKIPFIVALNKIDRIYGWKSEKDEDIEITLKSQSQVTRSQFKKLCQEIILQFANECLNVSLFYENKDPRSYISMVPTSAISGDGMGNLLSIATHLTQTLMHKKLIYSSELKATVLEVKAISGLGTTIDVILVNGRLQEGDTIILAGQDGPIVTQIRSLLMPQPLKELRVKNPYIEYKIIEGAQGVKITGRDLEKSIAGLPLFVASSHNMVDTFKEEINFLLRDIINSIKTSERGIYVQASTLGSLEALLDFLSISGVPYFHAKIGPVVKKDVMKASIMLEHDNIYAAILAFDVKIERDAQELADSLGVRIFHADIIYHLYDMYIKYRDHVLFKRNEEIRRLAVFPCKLRILPEFVYSLRDPIVLGVSVEQGIVKEGTPLCIPSRGFLDVGIISCIEMNNNKIDCAKKGDEVCISIDPKTGDSCKVYGKHFSHEDLLISRISRQSIDICKEHFRNELQSSDWHLIIELKKMLHIV